MMASSSSSRATSSHASTTTVPRSPAPSTDRWDSLIKRWQQEDLTVGQAIGQLLLWGRYLDGEITQLQRLHAQLERRVVALEQQQNA